MSLMGEKEKQALKGIKGRLNLGEGILKGFHHRLKEGGKVISVSSYSSFRELNSLL